MAYSRLKDGGLTIKGIAERLGKPGRAGQQRMRDHLAMLTLSEALHPQPACGEIPMIAVPALLTLHKAHAGLAELAAQRILEPEDAEGLVDDELASWCAWPSGRSRWSATTTTTSVACCPSASLPPSSATR